MKTTTKGSPLRTVFMRSVNCAGALAKPNGITRNSKAPNCDKRCFGDVNGIHADLVEPLSKVQLADNCVVLETFKQLFDAVHWVCQLDCVVVECTVVNTHPKFTVFLALEQDR